MPIELISALIGLLLTLMVFSYLIGDNPLFRISVYLFIGVASGYAAAIVWHSVLVPKLFQPLMTFNPLAVVPLVFGVSLLAKLSARTAWIGSFAMAVLVGVGAAAAVGGALIGTLLPQTQAAIDGFDILSAGSGLEAASRLLEGVIMLGGTVFTLASFHFSAGRAADGIPKRNQILEGIAWVGRIFLAITFGVLFAGVYMSALTAMIERLSFVLNFIRGLVGF
ncbi:MAG TPA: hypothetical protein VFG81_04680 [Anaerolineales bacterium]|jgi:hypothetical protein|nr:hypothetical protein [Anaerolineales bacterium]